MSTTANNAHRLNRPKLVRWFLKMDAFGGLPEWWQWFIPRYKKYGGVGFSAGRWLKTGDKTDWSEPAGDALDEIFKKHDFDYQHGELWVLADVCLIASLHNHGSTGPLYARLYRNGAIVAFSAHVLYMLLLGRWNYLEPISNEGEMI